LLAVIADEQSTAVVVAVIGAVALLGTQVLNLLATHKSRRIGEEGRATITEAIDTGNGHTLGQAVARLEDQASEHTDRLDTVEVLVREARDASTLANDSLQMHLQDVGDDMLWVREARQKEEPDA
jgi:hypothetical protein